MNLITVENGEEEYGLFLPEYRFRSGDVALLSGTDDAMELFAGEATQDREGRAVVSNPKRVFPRGMK